MFFAPKLSPAWTPCSIDRIAQSATNPVDIILKTGRVRLEQYVEDRMFDMEGTKKMGEIVEEEERP